MTSSFSIYSDRIWVTLRQFQKSYCFLKLFDLLNQIIKCCYYPPPQRSKSQILGESVLIFTKKSWAFFCRCQVGNGLKRSKIGYFWSKIVLRPAGLLGFFKLPLSSVLIVTKILRIIGRSVLTLYYRGPQRRRGGGNNTTPVLNLACWISRWSETQNINGSTPFGFNLPNCLSTSPFSTTCTLSIFTEFLDVFSKWKSCTTIKIRLRFGDKSPENCEKQLVSKYWKAVLVRDQWNWFSKSKPSYSRRVFICLNSSSKHLWYNYLFNTTWVRYWIPQTGQTTTLEITANSTRLGDIRGAVIRFQIQFYAYNIM